MTPFDRAAALHASFRTGWTFAEIIEAHADGCAIITPDVFVLARGVRSTWPSDWMSDPLSVAKEPDCWHVFLLAGDYRSAWRHMPFLLPFVSFHRRGVLRVYPMERLKGAFAP